MLVITASYTILLVPWALGSINATIISYAGGYTSLLLIVTKLKPRAICGLGKTIMGGVFRGLDVANINNQN